MKKLALSLAVAAAPFIAQAETIEIEKPSFYGKLNVTQEFVQPENAGNYSQLNSNASRLGLKGKIALDHGLTGIYQVEYEVNADDGTESKSGNTLTQRNTFAGVKGEFGEVIVGMFDTPFKATQNKIDLFNDLRGDIKNVISNSENREANSVQYTSPNMGGAVVTVDHINSEDEDTNNGLSASVAYTLEDIYLAAAYDNEVEGETINAYRVVGQFTVDAIQLGALWESQDTDGESKDGWLASAQLKMNSTVALKAQFGFSDIKTEGGSTFSLGADYKLAKTAKTFVYVTQEDSDDESINATYIGGGLEYKF
ncbi:porin [Thalassolituus oleivorans]|uniref:Outer membrane protein (Porin) n=1 Tax=Thalassolituus oleivorans MIL-1 TaxID=1298593 RepID=M5DMJ6_9GAMM|nr:porin [Thalassolituus oleivorans]CCU70598.1 outer membrane protein (porin) [Thalassolituus oleivorans MIL-1]